MPSARRVTSPPLLVWATVAPFGTLPAPSLADSLPVAPRPGDSLPLAPCRAASSLPAAPRPAGSLPVAPCPDEPVAAVLFPADEPAELVPRPAVAVPLRPVVVVVGPCPAVVGPWGAEVVGPWGADVVGPCPAVVGPFGAPALGPCAAGAEPCCAEAGALGGGAGFLSSPSAVQTRAAETAHIAIHLAQGRLSTLYIFIAQIPLKQAIRRPPIECPSLCRSGTLPSAPCRSRYPWGQPWPS